MLVYVKPNVEFGGFGGFGGLLGRDGGDEETGETFGLGEVGAGGLQWRKELNHSFRVVRCYVESVDSDYLGVDVDSN